MKRLTVLTAVVGLFLCAPAMAASEYDPDAEACQAVAVVSGDGSDCPPLWTSPLHATNRMDPPQPPRLTMREAQREAARQMRSDWMPYLGAGRVTVKRCHRVDQVHATCRGRVRAARGSCTFSISVREVADGYTYQLRHLRCG